MIWKASDMIERSRCVTGVSHAMTYSGPSEPLRDRLQIGTTEMARLRTYGTHAYMHLRIYGG